MRRYGWKRQLPDFRDFKYKAPARVLRALPPSVDLRPMQPPVYDQESLGSCTGNAVGAGHQFGQVKGLLSPDGTADAAAVAAALAKSFVPSRLFIYYGEREMEGTVGEDAGAYIRDGLKVVAKSGACPEGMWPYDVSKFRDKPSPECYKEAEEHQVLVYRAVDQTLDEMRGCLAEGFPFVFGFSVYSSFESDVVAKTGVMPMPGPGESLLGGHAVIAVGYDDAKRRFVVRNSWGSGWGDKGYFYMPYDFIANLGMASDFWTIRMVEDEDAEQPQPGPEPPKPEPSACDWSLALPMVKQFLDAAVVEANKGRTADEAVVEGLKVAQVFAARAMAARGRKG